MASSQGWNISVGTGGATLYDSTATGGDDPATVITVSNSAFASDGATANTATIKVQVSDVHKADRYDGIAPGCSITYGRGNGQGKRRVTATAVSGTANVNTAVAQAIL